MDSTVFYQTTTIIIAVAAICSPVVTAIINNWHDTKIKRLEMQRKNKQDYDLHVRDIFEQYIRYAGKTIALTSQDALHSYGEYYPLALHYAADSHIPLMQKLNALITEGKMEYAQSVLSDVSIALRQETEPLQKPPTL